MTRDVCTTTLPFQTLEHIDEPRTETKLQGDLFDPRRRQLRGWTNKLIYIHPPFDVDAEFSMDIEIDGQTFHKAPKLLAQIACRDTRAVNTEHRTRATARTSNDTMTLVPVTAG